MSAEKANIRSLTESELVEFLQEKGVKPFRAKQIFEWIWKKSCTNWDEMTNISLDLRQTLKENFTFHTLTPDDVQHSNDGTIKTAFKLHDNYVVEGVLIPAKDRMTACISSQVGCSLSCKFCATGKLKRMRNLNPDEIYDQVVTIKRQAEGKYDKNLSNIVFMGMGEPLLNYKNTLAGIDKICGDTGLGMSPKRITVSTAGIAKQIKQLADDDVKFNLALSLHAANDEKRSQIMPINDSNTLDALREALRYFHDKTGTRVTFEYIIFKDFNDELGDARELAAFCKTLPCKINIIEYNPIDGEEFRQAKPEKVDAFAEYLESKKLVVNVRRSRGKDIDAACGQLANKNKLAQE
jgi:23S rRNA (adenine2503-C2)-methyltransferase